MTNIDITTISDKDNNKHFFAVKFPNGDTLKYDILLEHYDYQQYTKFRNEIMADVKVKMRQIKLSSIKQKLK